MIAGVLGGLARRWNIDAGRLRVVFVAFSVLSAAFPGILVYLALWYLFPDDS
jgi:phage shock protein C